MLIYIADNHAQGFRTELSKYLPGVALGRRCVNALCMACHCFTYTVQDGCLSECKDLPSCFRQNNSKPLPPELLAGPTCLIWYSNGQRSYLSLYIYHVKYKKNILTKSNIVRCWPVRYVYTEYWVFRYGWIEMWEQFDWIWLYWRSAEYCRPHRLFSFVYIFKKCKKTSVIFFK